MKNLMLNKYKRIGCLQPIFYFIETKKYFFCHFTTCVTFNAYLIKFISFIIQIRNKAYSATKALRIQRVG